MKSINRHPNRLEKLIQAEIKKECRPRWSSLWGQKVWIEPAFVDTERGDCLQLVWVQPMDTRPDYYILRIDSREDVCAEEYEWDELLLCPIEENYDNIDRYEHFWQGHRYMGRERHETDPIIKEMQWPMLHWSGGTWGVIKNWNKPAGLEKEVAG